MKEAVGIIIVNQNDEILLLQRSGAENSERGKWSIVGGVAKQGEQPVDTAIRQIREELRMLVEPQHLQLITENNFSYDDTETPHKARIFLLLPKLKDIPGIGEPHLTSTYRWVPKHELHKYPLASYTEDDLKYLGWT